MPYFDMAENTYITTKNEVNGRFAVLFNKCKKYHPLLCNPLREMQRIVNDNIDGHIPDMIALAQIRGICLRFGLTPNHIDKVIAKVDNAQHGRRPVEMFNLHDMMLSAQNLSKNRKKGRFR